MGTVETHMQNKCTVLMFHFTLKQFPSILSRAVEHFFCSITRLEIPLFFNTTEKGSQTWQRIALMALMEQYGN